MAIELEWQDENGETLAEYEGPPLDMRVWENFPRSGACLRFIDPYGLTLFNRSQIPVLLDELDALATAGIEIEAIEAVLQFASQAVGKVHTYLKFIGD